MRVGIDFDNTIAGYDDVFVATARSEGFLADSCAKTKMEVREALRALPGGEQDWMRLQGRVYGAHMKDAELIEGVEAFLKGCRSKSVPVCIVSHKTEFGHFDPDHVNLRDVARDWLETKGFFDERGFGLSRGDVYFETTREEKVARIGAIGCTHFIDDLEEVFGEPGFPEKTERYLYANGANLLPSGPFKAFGSWNEIADDILGD